MSLSKTRIDFLHLGLVLVLDSLRLVLLVRLVQEIEHAREDSRGIDRVCAACCLSNLRRTGRERNEDIFLFLSDLDAELHSGSTFTTSLRILPGSAFGPVCGFCLITTVTVPFTRDSVSISSPSAKVSFP